MLIDGDVWFPTDIGLVLVDRESNTIGRLLTFADDYFPAYGSAVGFGSVWLGDLEDGRIARIALSDLAD